MNKKRKLSDASPEAKAHKLKKRRLQQLLTGLVAAIIVAAGGAYIYTQRGGNAEEAASNRIKSILKADEAEKNKQIIVSEFDFSVSFDTRQFEAEGYVPDASQTAGYKQVTGDDLKSSADYYHVYIFSPDEGGSISQKIVGAPVFGVGTNVNDNFFDAGRAAGKADLDYVEERLGPKNTTNTVVAVKQKDTVKVGDIEYRRVMYTRTDSEYFATNKTEEYYYTVQNDRPYVVSIDNASAREQDQVAAVRGLLRNIRYGLHEQLSTSYGGANSGTNGQTNSGNTTVNTPSQLQDDTALTVAAKNQPGVVRIGANYCADLTLLLPNKSPYMTVKDACAAGIGSGSIVSGDGYISTNGHVVQMTPAIPLVNALLSTASAGDSEPLQQYLEYLVRTGVMTASTLDRLLSAASQGDPVAQTKLFYSAESIPRDRVSEANQKTEYAIQLGREPLRLEQIGARPTFGYSESIVTASFIASDFDPYEGQEGRYDIFNSTTSDVAILKMEKTNLPVISLGNIDDLAPGDLITAIGFPAFVDGGLDTELEYTVPTVTQGSVEFIEYDSPQKVRKLVFSNTPIAGGNSGGPAFSKDGKMAGLNTYGGQPSCAVGECFAASSTFRDVTDYKALLATSKIELQTDSEATKAWHDGINLFAKSRYSAAVKAFKTAQAAYPQLYLADSFIVAAEEGIANGQDVTDSALKKGLPIVLIIAAVIGIVAAIIVIRKLVRHKSEGLAQGYYMPQPVSAPVAYAAQPVPVMPPAPAVVASQAPVVPVQLELPPAPVPQPVAQPPAPPVPAPAQPQPQQYQPIIINPQQPPTDPPVATL